MQVSGLAGLLVAASVSGKVVWTSAGPPLVIEAPNDPHVCGQKGPVSTMRPAYADDGGVISAVVFLDPDAGAAAAPVSVNVEQANCQFTPRILNLTSGSSVTFSNDDPLLHNVHVKDEKGDTIANFTMPVRGQTTPPIVFRRPGIYRVECDAGHFWMNAWIRVFAKGASTQSDEQGHFRLDAPPGRYSLVAWHPDLGTTTSTVVLSDEAHAKVRLIF